MVLFKKKKSVKTKKASEDNFFTADQPTSASVPTTTTEEEWLQEEEGQLSVDVYQDKDNIIIKSTIAGVKPEDIDISISNDLITIKGKREMEETVKDEDYFYQECYWGSFSRSIILPMEVKADQAKAELKNGILTIVLPKAKPSKAVSIKVKGE